MPPSSKPKKAKKEARAPALASPRTICPITGEEIKIVKAGDKWIAHTSLWTSRPYEFRDTLVYMLSHYEGVSPDMPRPGISVGDVTRPPDKYPVGPVI